MDVAFNVPFLRVQAIERWGVQGPLPSQGPERRPEHWALLGDNDVLLREAKFNAQPPGSTLGFTDQPYAHLVMLDPLSVGAGVGSNLLGVVLRPLGGPLSRSFALSFSQRHAGS